jgi:hypothetical protein
MFAVRRRLSTLAAGVSTALFVGVVVLWVRSHRRVDLAEWLGTSRGVRLWSSAGVLAVHVFVRQGGGDAGQWSLQSGPHGGDYYIYTPGDRFGFGWVHAGPVLDDTIAYVPYWFLSLSAAAPPVVWWVRRRRRRRRARAGLCPACGYDLRATPGRCPECGAVAAR